MLGPVKQTPRRFNFHTKIYFRRMQPKSQCPPRKSHSKIWWSGLGAFLGILVIELLNHISPTKDTIFLIGSFGASAVLVYGAPNAELSQPRNLIGGHVLSAIIGVSVAQIQISTHVFDDYIYLTSSLAVALSIICMHYTRTLHPPGGATALIAVLGGEQIQRLGWVYVFCPVGLGAIAMMLIGLIVNNISRNPKRHYPRYWF